MASFNKIIIVGFLGRDPELRYTPQGTPVCSFSVATTEKRKDKSGEMQESTTWFKVTVFGKQGEMANEYLSKGRQVFVEGRLRQEEYTDRDGNKRTSLEVTASDIQFIGARGEQSEGIGEPKKTAAPSAKREPGTSSETPPEVVDDDIPF